VSLKESNINKNINCDIISLHAYVVQVASLLGEGHNEVDQFVNLVTGLNVGYLTA
jgi:hypothetical protein